MRFRLLQGLSRRPGIRTHLSFCKKPLTRNLFHLILELLKRRFTLPPP